MSSVVFSFRPIIRACVGLMCTFGLVLAATGCDPEWRDESDIRVVLGSADGEDVIFFDEDTPDAKFVMETGFQGGAHINLLVFAENVPLDERLRATLWIDDADGNEIEAFPEDIYFDSYFDQIDGLSRSWVRAPVLNSYAEMLANDFAIRVQFLHPNGDVGRGKQSAPVRWSTFDQERMAEQEPTG